MCCHVPGSTPSVCPVSQCWDSWAEAQTFQRSQYHHSSQACLTELDLQLRDGCPSPPPTEWLTGDSGLTRKLAIPQVEGGARPHRVTRRILEQQYSILGVPSETVNVAARGWL